MLNPNIHKPIHTQNLSREDLYQMVQELQKENRSLKAQQSGQLNELHEQIDQLKTLFENTADLLLTVDKDMRILLINRACRQALHRDFGHSVSPGDCLKDIMPPKAFQSYMEKLAPVFQGERLRILEESVFGNEQFIIESQFFPLKDKNEQVVAYAYYGKDITERHLAEAEIRQKEQLLRSINHSITEGIFRSTPQDGILYVNRAFVEMFGYENKAEMLKLEPYELYVDNQRRDDFRRIMETESYFKNEEVEFQRKDGSRFWGLVSSIKAVSDNGKVYFDGAIRDVSEIREARFKLENQNQELRKVNNELDKLVYSTSHDLRAPLVSLLGLISIARVEENSSLRNQYFDLMVKSLNKLDDFIKDIIGYSRNSRAELRKETINFQKIFDDAFNNLRHAERYAGIKRKLNIKGKGNFNSDPARLQIIFNNLLSNACRYSDKDKEDSFIEVTILNGPDSTQIEVRDNGIGIEQRYMDKIFDMFYRATNNSEGSGIGLYIVREAVNKLGGIINVQSEVGKGTSFLMEFPSNVSEDRVSSYA